MTWYADELLGYTSTARKDALSKLPPNLINLLSEEGLDKAEANENGVLPLEIMNMVREYFDGANQTLPMTVADAKKHRAKLMQERSAFQQTAESGWQEHTYSFCEH